MSPRRSISSIDYSPLNLVFQIGCLEVNRPCPSGYYSDPNAQHSRLSPGGYTCLTCHPSCALCTGPHSDDCQACQTALVRVGGTVQECRTSCGNVTGDCQFCHPQCSGCNGPTNRDCVRCLHASASSTQGTICVPTCSSNEFLADINGEFICLPCHSQCDRCRGPESTDCLRCLSFNNTLSGGGNCVTTCPSNSYVGGRSQCLACDDQCVGCNGPSNLNCSVCAEESRVTSGGIVQCVQRCPLWQLFDVEQNSCVLSQ